MKFFVKTIKQSIKPIKGLKVAYFLPLLIICTNMIKAENIKRYENQNNIRNTAKIFLEEMTISADTKNIELNIGKIDPRLKLKKCNQPLIAFLPQGSKQLGKLNVGIKCNGPVAWKVFISATRYQFQTVVIANNAISKGSLISKQDLGYKRIKTTNFRKQPAIDISQVIMASPRRFIRAGSVIYMNNICMVCKGNKVNVSAGSEFFSINLEAEALADASVGENVRLRNSKSRRIFDGTVIGRNRAKVLLVN